jgi:MFS family permease
VLLASGLLVIGLWNVPAGLFAGTVVVGLGHALAFPSLMTLAVNSAPASERSSVVGTFSAFTELGFLFGSLTLGAIASRVGYDGIFVVCALGPLLGALVLVRVAARQPIPAPEAA